MRIIKAVFYGVLGLMVLTLIGSWFGGQSPSGSSANIAPQGPTVEQIAAQKTERAKQIGSLRRIAVRRACQSHDEWTVDDCVTIDQKKIRIGMTGEQVRLAWGPPEKVNSTIFAGHRNEQWVYADGSDYVYVDNGIVTSMQSSQ